MNVLHEPIFWLFAAACLAISSIPSLLRSIDRRKAAIIVTLWAMACGTIYILFGTIPAIISALCSAVWGAFLLAASLIRSGVKSMPNNRFENR